MYEETKIKTKLQSKLKELETQLDKVENMIFFIASDWKLKNHIGTVERDKILSYYRKERFSLEEKIKLLTAITEGE